MHKPFIRGDPQLVGKHEGVSGGGAVAGCSVDDKALIGFLGGLEALPM